MAAWCRPDHFATGFEPSVRPKPKPAAEVLNAEPNPLTQLINLRGQAEKASKTQQMYEKRVGGWLEWEDVQKARVAAMNKLNDAAQAATPCCPPSQTPLLKQGAEWMERQKNVQPQAHQS